MWNEFRSDPDQLVFIVCVVVGGLALMLVNSMH